MGPEDPISNAASRNGSVQSFINGKGKAIAGIALSLVFLGAIAGCSRKPEELPFPEGRENGGDVLISRLREPWKGDLDAILGSRRIIRVLASYSKTSFAVVQGRPQGLEYELLHDYETFLGAKVGRHRIKPLVVFIAVPREQLIPLLLEGRGDIAAGIAITPELEKLVSFTVPYIRDVREVVVTGRAVSWPHSLDDLSGRTVHVVAGSGHEELLKELDLLLLKKGRRPMRIVEADKSLEAEDVLEMVNAGIFSAAVVEEYIAELWAGVLPDIVVHKGILPDKGTDIAWAVRKENPELLSSLNEFINTKARHGLMLGDILLDKYYGNTKWIRNPIAVSERLKLVKYQSYLEEYAKLYGFDWLKIAAMAYQESHLDGNIHSPSGAVGIMQMLPKAAHEVGIRNIDGVENNIHAGVKYLAYLRDTYFNDAGIAPADKMDFALAAYNAGPVRIGELRRKAGEMGLDPNKWFFNVERVALRETGWETVQYVANIYKYYIAYKSAEIITREKRLKRRA
jgi:membrane-bound lytic murein transglycosylase MltF